MVEHADIAKVDVVDVVELVVVLRDEVAMALEGPVSRDGSEGVLEGTLQLVHVVTEGLCLVPVEVSNPNSAMLIVTEQVVPAKEAVDDDVVMEMSESHAMVLHGECVSDPECDDMGHLSSSKDCPSEGESLERTNVVRGGRLLRSSTRVPSIPSCLNL